MQHVAKIDNIFCAYVFKRGKFWTLRFIILHAKCINFHFGSDFFKKSWLSNCIRNNREGRTQNYAENKAVKSIWGKNTEITLIFWVYKEWHSYKIEKNITQKSDVVGVNKLQFLQIFNYYGLNLEQKS